MPAVALALLGLALAACAPKGEALYQRAQASLDKGDVRAALIDLKNLVKDEPSNASARALLATAMVESVDFGAADVELKKARELGAPAGLLLYPECRLMIARAEFDESLAKCRPDLGTEETRPQLHIVRGQSLLGLERAAEAKAEFQTALKARPSSLDALLGIAASDFQIGGLEASKAVLEKAPEEFKKQYRYWMAVGGLYMRGSDYAGAEASFQQAVTHIAKGAEGIDRILALGSLAEAQIRQGKVKEATATTDQLMKAAPRSPIVKQVRAQVAAAGGNLEEARMLLEEVVAARPDNYEARMMLGMVALQQGNTGQAEMHFANVVANQPKNTRAQRLLAATRAKMRSPAESLESMKASLNQSDADPSLLAMASRMSLASGNREQALQYLSQAEAQASGGDAPAAQIEIASGYMMAGDLDRAVELLEKMPEGGKTDLQREYLLMLALLRKGEQDKALAQAKALIERSPGDPMAHNLAAAVYAAAGNNGAARDQLNESLKLKSDSPGTLLALARLDMAEGKMDQAERRFRETLQKDPENMVAELGMAYLAGSRGDRKEAEKWLVKAATDHRNSVQAQLALAQFYIGGGDFAKAKTVLDEAIATSPDDASLSNARGMALLGAKDLPGAIASFKKATEQAPSAYGYALNLARAHQANRDTEAALSVLNATLKTEPKYLPALALAAAISLATGQAEKATGYVERLRQAAPDNVVTLSLEGDLAMAQKRYGDALQFYRNAMAKSATRELAIAQYKAGQLASVAQPEKPLEDWLKTRPDDFEVVTLLADYRQGKGDTEGAIKLYEQSLEKTPDSVLLLNNLAVLYQQAGSPKALPTAERAYKAAPKAAAVQDTYGWILLEQGKVDVAVPMIEQAYNAIPDNPEIQYHYAVALAKTGKKTEAVALLKKAVAGQLPEKVKADARKLLEELSR